MPSTPLQDVGSRAATRARSLLSTRRRRRIARWTVGPVVATARYLMAVPDVVEETRTAFEPDRPAPDLLTFDDVLLPSGGTGPVYHRRYRLHVTGLRDPAGTITSLCDRPNRYFPVELGHLELPEPDAGDEVRIRQGHDLVVEITGPYHGPVRVVLAEDRLVRLQTRQTHMEAGVSEFRVDDADDGGHWIVVESWARSADPAMDRIYRSGVGAAAQRYMWTRLCRALGAAHGQPAEAVEVLTERLPPLPDRAGERSSTQAPQPGGGWDHHLTHE